MKLKINPATNMDHKINNNHNDNDDALSLRDLQMYDQTTTSSARSSPRAFPDEEQFEFFPTPIATEVFEPTTIWLGNTSPNHHQVVSLETSHSVDERNYEEPSDHYNHNRDYLKAIGSSSLRLHDRPMKHKIPMRSVSSRDIGSPRHGVKVLTSVKKVNHTTLTWVPTKSKRKMFMFGPVKFKPEMEMRSIRERQGRRAPSRMFPMAEGGDDGLFDIRSGSENIPEKRKGVVGGPKNTVTCRARLNYVLEKSIACLRI